MGNFTRKIASDFHRPNVNDFSTTGGNMKKLVFRVTIFIFNFRIFVLP